MNIPKGLMKQSKFCILLWQKSPLVLIMSAQITLLTLIKSCTCFLAWINCIHPTPPIQSSIEKAVISHLIWSEFNWKALLQLCFIPKERAWKGMDTFDGISQKAFLWLKSPNSKGERWSPKAICQFCLRATGYCQRHCRRGDGLGPRAPAINQKLCFQVVPMLSWTGLPEGIFIHWESEGVIMSRGLVSLRCNEPSLTALQLDTSLLAFLGGHIKIIWRPCRHHNRNCTQAC